ETRRRLPAKSDRSSASRFFLQCLRTRPTTTMRKGGRRIMPNPSQTPLVRLGNLFPKHDVYAKCEYLAPSGCFKIRGARHLLDHLSGQGGTRHLVVASMGNTALGAATAAKEHGFRMTGVVPQTIARAKDEKLRALGAELIKIDGGGSDLLRHATDLARESG